MHPPPSFRPALTGTLACCIAATAAALMAGCAASPLASVALDMLGLKHSAPVPEAQQAPRQVAIRLHAGENLNADRSGQPLALVARIYKLRQSAAFEQAPYDSFLNAQKEKELLGSDLLEVREVLLIPGQRYEMVEKVSREAYYIGVVALFRAPAAQRWRMAFGTSEAEKSGITIGLHACAMSVGAASASLGKAGAGAAAGSAALAAVRCT